jgi:hypothetical protein
MSVGAHSYTKLFHHVKRTIGKSTSAGIKAPINNVSYPYFMA